METTAVIDRNALIERIVKNQQALYRAGASGRLVTAEGFLFTSDEKLLKLEHHQKLVLATYKLDAAA